MHPTYIIIIESPSTCELVLHTRMFYHVFSLQGLCVRLIGSLSCGRASNYIHGYTYAGSFAASDWKRSTAS